jgi:hypothetical protein
MLLRDRVGIVSGIGPGVGREVAVAFAREGADVVLAARTPAALEEAAAAVRALGRRALAVPTDIARPEDCGRLAEAARTEFGRIDVLVNNAFVSGRYDPIENASMDDWRRVFDVNVFGSIQLTQAVVPAMKAQGGGSIVMVNSMSIRVIEPRFGRHPDPGPRAGSVRHPGELGRAGVHREPEARGLLRAGRQGARNDPGGGEGGDRRADGAQPHPGLGRDRRRGGVLRLGPVAGGERPGARRERGPLLPLRVGARRRDRVGGIPWTGTAAAL